MFRRPTRADVASADFCPPIAVPTYDNVPNNGPSEVRRASGSLNPLRGVEEVASPSYAEAKRPTGGEEEFITEFSDDDDDEFVDCFLPNDVPTYDIVLDIGLLSEVGHTGSSNLQAGGENDFCPIYDEAKSPNGGEEEFITEFSDDEFVDCFLPNDVPTYDIVLDIELLSEVGRAGSSNLQAGGQKDFCPIYNEAKSPNGGEEQFNTEFSDDDDDEFVDCFLPNDVPTYDIVHDLGLLSEVGRAGSSNLQAGGEKDFCPIYDEAKIPNGGEEECITEFSDDDDDEFVDCFLPNDVPTYDIVHDIRLLSEVGRTGSSNLQAGGEKDFCPIYDEANSPTENPPKSQNKFIKSMREGWKKFTHPFSKKNEEKTSIPSELNADSDNPNVKDDAGRASPESKTKISPDKQKGIFGFLQKGKVKPVPTSPLKADPAIPDVREVVDLAGRQLKTKVCPKKRKQKASKGSFLDNFWSKKSKTVVPTQQLHADPAIPVAMDSDDLASRELKTHISFDHPDLKADIAAANAELQTCVGSANIGPRTTISPNPGLNDADKPGPNDAVKPSPKDGKPWLKTVLTNKSFIFKYDYSFRDVLGKGSSGKVYKGKRRSDGKEVAIKIMDRTEEDKYLVIPGYSEPLLTEVALMLKMREARSPSVLEMYDWYKDPTRFTLVLEYPQTCETLWDFVFIDDRPISESAARPLMYQAVQAVQDCLNHGVFHIDVHLGNFLFDRVNRRVTLIDFGLGHLLTDDGYYSKDFRGALQCAPPEIHTKTKYYAMPTNVWALGIMLYCMLHKFYSFPRKVEKSHKLRISKTYFSKGF